MGMRISNAIVFVVNVLGLLLSLTLVGVGARWFSLRGGASECGSALRLPFLAAGLALFVASALGLAGACWRRASTLLWIYQLLIFLLILAIFSATVAAFILTAQGGAQGHRRRDFAHFLHRSVWEWKNWAVIESCLRGARVCGLRTVVGPSTSVFLRPILAPIKSGCCKPPGYCQFSSVNATYWKVPEADVTPPDCEAWSNEGSKRCFDCDSCKGGVLTAVKEWCRNITIVNVLLLAFLIILHTVGGCALQNHRRRCRIPSQMP